MFLIRKIGIVFVVAGILSTTGILHFAKNLPDMIAHYEHHNKEHEKVGFLIFLPIISIIPTTTKTSIRDTTISRFIMIIRRPAALRY